MLEVTTLELNEQLTSLLVTLLRIISIDSTSSATVFCMSEMSIMSSRINESPSIRWVNLLLGFILTQVTGIRLHLPYRTCLPVREVGREF